MLVAAARPNARATGLIALIFLALLTSACGGGGGGNATSSGGSSGGGSSGGSGSGSGSGTAAPSVTADTTSFSPTLSPTGTAPSYQVHFTVNNPSGVAIYYTYAYPQTIISSLDLNSPLSSNGQEFLTLSFAPWSPGLIGSGTYQGQIQVNFCLDQQCTKPIAGSPVAISITYTVTGNSVSNATFTVTPSGGLTVEEPDTATSATATISVYTDQLPPYTTYLMGQSEANGVVANGSWLVNANGAGATGTLTVNLKSPSSLGPGVYSDSIKLSICYDQACTKPAIRSPWTLPVSYTVTATEGADYNASMLAVTASDIAWSSVTQKLYAVTTASSAQYPSTLLEIDPATATVTRSLSLSSSPTVLSLSDDGSYAYVGFSDQGVIDRIALSTMSLELSIPTPVDPTYGTTYVGYLAAVPGEPQSLAASFYAFGTGLTDWDSRGTYIYDGATQRPDTSFTPSPTTRVMALVFGADASILYSYDGNQQHLVTSVVSSMGITESNEADGVAISGNMTYLNGFLYGDDGSVTDPSSGAKVADFLQSGSVLEPVVAVDGTLSRAYFFYQEQLTSAPLWTFATYNLQTQAVLEKTRVNGCTLTLGGVNGKSGRLVRFSANGLAVNCNEGIEIISGNFVTN